MTVRRAAATSPWYAVWSLHANVYRPIRTRIVRASPPVSPPSPVIARAIRIRARARTRTRFRGRKPYRPRKQNRSARFDQARTEPDMIHPSTIHESAVHRLCRGHVSLGDRRLEIRSINDHEIPRNLPEGEEIRRLITGTFAGLVSFDENRKIGTRSFAKTSFRSSIRGWLILQPDWSINHFHYERRICIASIDALQ